jgi:hypothetical protein
MILCIEINRILIHVNRLIDSSLNLSKYKIESVVEIDLLDYCSSNLGDGDSLAFQ